MEISLVCMYNNMLIIKVQFVPFDCCKRKKRNFEINCFTLNRGILLVFLVLYVLTEVGIILNRYFGHLYQQILKKQHSFLYHLLFSRVSKLTSLYSFSLDVPLRVPVIANAALH